MARSRVYKLTTYMLIHAQSTAKNSLSLELTRKDFFGKFPAEVLEDDSVVNDDETITDSPTIN